ncbi:MAG: hypothetical protein IKR25_03685 [Muribaculaceae bacterium]|nr:hypothetical protein [Muribaculaceae bacterium]
MKILVFTPKEGASPQACEVELYPDSSLVFTNRALFLPECGELCCRAAVVARIGRLGKSIASQYAMRYCDAVTAGFVTLPMDDDSDPTMRWFDGSLTCGEMTPHDFETGCSPLLTWQCGTQMCAGPDGPVMTWLSDAIVASSRHMTLKTGDLLYMTSPQLHRVHRGDELHGCFNGNDVLTIRVK